MATETLDPETLERLAIQRYERMTLTKITWSASSETIKEAHRKAVKAELAKKKAASS